MGRDGDKPALMVRGDAVSFELAGGRVIDLPESWGMIHDPSGENIRKCDIVISNYTLVDRAVRSREYACHTTAHKYWGDEMPLFEGVVDVPSGPWSLVNKVAAIWYQRHGKHEGPYRHEFRPMVELYRNPGGDMLLALPSGCVLDWRGFVWP